MVRKQLPTKASRKPMFDKIGLDFSQPEPKPVQVKEGKKLYKSFSGGLTTKKPERFLLVVPYSVQSGRLKNGEIASVAPEKMGNLTFGVKKAKAGVFYTDPIVIYRPPKTPENVWKQILQIKADKVVEAMQDDYDEFQGEDSWTLYERAKTGLITIKAPGSFMPKMRMRGSFKYSGAGIISIADDGKCVPSTLKQIYPKMSLAKILAGLGAETDEEGITVEQVLNFCKKYDITCVGVDGFDNPLVRYMSRNNNRKPLYFVCRDSHFYLMDAAKTKYYQKVRGNSSYRPTEAKEKVIKQIIVSDEPTFGDAHYVVSSLPIMSESLTRFIKTTNTVPNIHLGATESNSIYVKGFSTDKFRVSVNKQWNIVKELKEKTGLEGNVVSDITSLLVKEILGEVPTSRMNTVLFDLFKNYHSTQHYAQLYEEEQIDSMSGTLQAWDVNKQYSAILRNNPYPWYVFNTFAMPTPFDGEVKDGFYFVETENTCPCKGNGLYSRAIVEYLIKNEIPHRITQQILPSSTLPSAYFEKFVDAVIEKTDNFKYVLNTFIGMLNKNNKKKSSLKVFRSQQEAFMDVWNYKTNYMEVAVDTETNVYVSAYLKTKNLYSNNMPFNCQILDLAAIQLAEGMKHLEAKGAVIVKYKVDSITFKADEFEIDLSTSKLGGWKKEEVKPFSKIALPKPSIKQLDNYNFQWAKTVNEGDCDLVDFLSTNSAMLNGAAGYGKSWLLNRVIEKVGADKCCAVSFTNMAANNIDGSTFHRMFKIRMTATEGNYDIERVLDGKEVLIVDEISMIPEWLYSNILAAKMAGLRIICAGDFSQLMPVRDSISAEDSDLLKMLCENQVNLTIYKRGNSELLSALTSVRTRESVPFEKGEHGELHFVFTHYQRDKINKKFMRGRGWETGVESVPRIYNGLPLRSCVSKEDGSLLNGERFVVKCDNLKESIEIHSLLRDNVRILELADLKDFLPGYAITVHASQGITVTEPYTVWIERLTQFSEDETWRLIYTACSRATSFGQVKVRYC